jgi:Putative RNA methylase family UPF0020
MTLTSTLLARSLSSFESLCQQYQASGRPIEVNFRDIPPVANASRSAHLIHPYPAKLLARIPQFFLNCPEILQTQGMLLDPFCGSGTVLLEGQLAGMSVVGADSNPLARLITTVKLSNFDIARARDELDVIMRNAPSARVDIPDVVNRAHWYSERASKMLGRLRSAISTSVDDVRRPLFDVCLSATARRVSFADPRLSVPVRINPDRSSRYGAKGSEVIRKLSRLETVDVNAVFWSIANQNIKKISETQALLPQRPPLAGVYDSAMAIGLKDESVELVITSPPYVGAQKYIRASSLSLGWLGLTPNASLRPYERLSIGREHLSRDEVLLDVATVAAADDVIRSVTKVNFLRARIAQRYLIEMKLALREIARTLKPHGHFILVVGPNLVAGHCFDTPAYLRDLAEHEGLVPKLHLIDTISSRGLMTKRNRTAGIIEQESVLVFTKKGRRDA